MQDLHLSKLASIWLLLFLMLRPKKGLSFWKLLVGQWALIFAISSRVMIYCNQVLTYAQQSRERSNYEQAVLTDRMQEYRRQIDLEICWSSEGQHVFPNGDGIHTIGRGSHKLIEAVMQSAAKGKVQTIRQGYLLKRSSNLRGDWKRRFFFLDSRGMLYYYRKEKSKPSGRGSHLADQRNSSKMSPGLLSRWLSSRYHGGVHDKKSVAHHRVNLLTSTIKVDADQSDLRFEKLHFAGSGDNYMAVVADVE